MSYTGPPPFNFASRFSKGSRTYAFTPPFKAFLFFSIVGPPLYVWFENEFFKTPHFRTYPGGRFVFPYAFGLSPQILATNLKSLRDITRTPEGVDPEKLF